MNIKWIDYYTFESNGITISFKQAEPVKGETVPKYSFSVLENEELTKKLLDLVEQKRIKKANIYYCAINLFNIIEEKNLLIDIESEAVKKGIDEKSYYKINLIHRKGLLSKSFTLFEPNTFGTLKDWEDIFTSGVKIDYAKFLEQFELKIPEALFQNDDGAEFKDAIKKFKNNFNFK